MTQEQLRIDSDNDAIDIMDVVNDILKSHGLMFQDDGRERDGYMVYTLCRLGNEEQ